MDIGTKMAIEADHQRDIDADRYMNGADPDDKVEDAHDLLSELALLVGKYKDIDWTRFRVETQNEAELVIEHARALADAVDNDDETEAGCHFLALCKIHLG